jgi:hypothetical protein
MSLPFSAPAAIRRQRLELRAGGLFFPSAWHILGCALETKMRLFLAIVATASLFLAISQPISADVAVAGPSSRCCD